MFSSQPYEEHTTISNIVKWCKTGSYGRQGPIGLILRTGLEPFEDPDMRAIAEAIQVLEHAALVMRSPRPGGRGWGLRGGGHDVAATSGSNYIGLTRLGMHVLQTNTVRQHLGLGDATPTA
jgi:hypothetical protein